MSIRPTLFLHVFMGYSVKIGMGIINPRGIDAYAKVLADTRDFCYSHSSTKDMHEYIGKKFIAYPQIAGRIKEEVLKICPQYKDMIEKLMVLI